VGPHRLDTGNGDAVLRLGPLTAREVRVGVLIDGPSAREGISADVLEQAGAAVYGDGLTLTVGPQARLNGDWNVSTLNAALDRLEADPQIDVVVTLGFVASHLVAHRAQLSKPTIAASVLDPLLQTLLLSHRPFGFVAMLGVFALTGMIIRNSVVLIAQIQANESEGMDRSQAIVEATVHRLRPILLTAGAAVLGLIPIAGEVFWGPMAYAMMGGLLVATVLTLFFLPALYATWYHVREGV
jgi:hypothetical protein